MKPLTNRLVEKTPIALLVALQTLALSCSSDSFVAQKQAFLQSTTVMQAAAPADSANGQVSQGGADGEGSGNVPAPPVVSPQQPSIPIDRVCSDKVSKIDVNLKRAVAQSLPTTLLVNGKACVSDRAQLSQLLLGSSIGLDQLRSLCASAVVDGDNELALVVGGQDARGALARVTSSSRSKFTILYAANTEAAAAKAVDAPDANCTEKHSPLVIHLGARHGIYDPIALTSPMDGVRFDLLGARDSHRKLPISWLTNSDYAFLVLPDEQGRVRGIDELFGNNTKGPDAKFAANGYAALAKFDGRSADGRAPYGVPDGRIDAHDPIFSRLRLWIDRDLDGQASADELVSLEDAGIAYIDLGYSADFAEADRWGNETRMKSVVGFDDGSLGLIFDLWFVVQQGANK